MELKLQEATLETIANGALGEQFQGALGQAAAIFAEATSRFDCPYEAPKDTVKVKISIDIELLYSMESHTSLVTTRMGVKLPKLRTSVGSIYHKNHEWSVTHEGEQTTMFGADVKPIRGAKEA